MNATNQQSLIAPEAIRTASLYPLATLEERTAGTARVLVTRYWPRGLAKTRIDAWWQGAAPTRDMLAAYRNGLWDWETFARTYTGQFRWYEHDIRNAVRMRLIQSGQSGALTLLCVEHCPRDGQDESDIRCHRRLLRDLLLGQASAF